MLAIASSRRAALLTIAALCTCLFVGAVSAQSYFTECTSETGNNATIIFPASASIQVGDRPVEAGDEIAVFDAQERCAGAVRWTGEHVTLTVWGANEVTEEKDGLLPGEAMHFRLWNTSEEQVWGGGDAFTIALSDDKPYLTPENVYAPNRIYVVDSLHFAHPLQAAQHPSE